MLTLLTENNVRLARTRQYRQIDRDIVNIIGVTETGMTDRGVKSKTFNSSRSKKKKKKKKKKTRTQTTIRYLG